MLSSDFTRTLNTLLETQGWFHSLLRLQKRRNPALERDFVKAAEGIRTLDLLHGKQTRDSERAKAVHTGYGFERPYVSVFQAQCSGSGHKRPGRWTFHWANHAVRGSIRLICHFPMYAADLERQFADQLDQG